MLQDLFTDKNVPKLRFNGFDANWIQCKLEKEALLTMGQSPSGSTYSDQPSTYILVQGNADLKNGWVKPRIWTTQITKLAKKGDIIITVRAPAGKVGRTNFDVVLGRGVASIQGNDFIFYLLSKMDMNKYWKKYAAGSTFESINSNDIKNTRVHVPNLPEQNRIANLFLRLDDLIRFQQNKLNNLQKNKQFLLQNMFI
ncbi:restriction endonuclease subunit S [Lactobacillus crispatus]|nr:type I restriction-modification system specificity subunit [Lactobacillus crispatus DSM 20584 = JCM 1185 = ATCC 33820]QWW29976.1 restriction endonuclease subunit S [Lactobacillus crispatus]